MLSVDSLAIKCETPSRIEAQALVTGAVCVCACASRAENSTSKQQTCSKISWIYKLESYMWKSYALCQNLKANLTRRIIWIQNKTQSYKKNKDKHPDGRKIILPCGLQEVLGSDEVLSGFYMMEQFSGFMRPWGGDDRNIWFLFNKNNYLCNSTPNASFAVLMLRIQINKRWLFIDSESLRGVKMGAVGKTSAVFLHWNCAAEL